MITAGMWRAIVVACLAIAGAGPVLLAALQHPSPSDERVDFQSEVRPLLSDRCFRCHGPDGAKRKAKLRLDTREGIHADIGDGMAVVMPGQPDRSELVRRIYADDPDDLMPPPDSHLTLSADEKALLRTWVAQGAEYRAHWSLEPVADPVVPLVPGGSTSTNPIDAFVRTRLTRHGGTPASAAPPETRLRRLAFALTGLPPTRADLDAFSADPSAAAWSRAIEQYLASPAYGERMAMDWLDLARYADTYGYQADVERDVSPYRDWVIRAFNDNLPYDQFLTWQLAGDLLPDATRDQRVATAFNRLHRQTNEGGSIEEEFRIEYVLDRVHTFGTAMLGLTLECARCHDHKFDPITQREYYALSAFFNSIDESGLYSHFTNATPTPALTLWPAHAQGQHALVLEKIAAAEAALADIAHNATSAATDWHRTATVRPPAPVAHLTFDSVVDDTTPDRVLAEPARLKDGPLVVRNAPETDPSISAVQFSGDNAVEHPAVPRFLRTDPFSIAIRLRPTEHQARAIVLHQSRAWTDAGSRGFELTLEDGRPFFGLIHFWPGNAIAVRAREPLPLDRWSHLVVTYDGSSRAAGIRLYLDGAAVETDIVRDRLSRDIGYEVAPGERSAPAHPFTLGARFRDSGFRNGLVDDVQVFDTCLTTAEVRGTPPPDAHDPDVLAHFLARHHAPYRATLDLLRQLREEENRLVADVPEIMVMEELPEPRPAHLLARGAYDAPRDVVSRDTPASMPPFPSNEPRNRLGLARWLTSGTHPLTARVAVNRIWQLHFGRGLVTTTEDFGSQGSLPTHPELLDWLASRFVEIGWDVKALHRLILSSDTFQQASTASPDTRRDDPDNRLLARGPTLRLQAEQIRDGALAASGLLTQVIGGPSVKPYQPDGLWEQSGTGKTYVPDTGDRLYRRSLYTFWRRTLPPPSMTTFDAPTREVCTARREITSTPLQALVLLNDPQFVEAARVLAEQMVSQYPDEVAARIDETVRVLLGRRPDAVEQTILARHHAEQRALFVEDEASATRLLAIGARPRDDRLPAADVAAMTAVASLVMNLDEFVVVR
jgi:hypothetical protein